MKLNADLGEHEPRAVTRAMMRLIDLANIACGGHAGDVASMEGAVRLAMEYRVSIGAHPGLASDFGRGVAEIGGEDLKTLVSEQVSALADVARRQGAGLHHVKLHGAMYHAVENSDELASVYADVMRVQFPRVAIVALAAGKVSAVARKHGVPVLTEVFADRSYRPDGSLIPRGEPGDLITNIREIVAHMPSLHGDTVCVHADSPHALRIARAVRKVLGPRV